MVGTWPDYQVARFRHSNKWCNANITSIFSQNFTKSVIMEIIHSKHTHMPLGHVLLKGVFRFRDVSRAGRGLGWVAWVRVACLRIIPEPKNTLQKDMT